MITKEKNKGNIPIDKKLLNRYENVTELINNSLDNIEINILAKDIEELKDKNFYILKQNELSNIAIYIFHKYHNTNIFVNDGNLIKVTNGGIRESINKIIYNKNQKRYLKEHLQIFSILGLIIESSTLVAQNYENKKRENNKVWHYYLNGININKTLYLLQFDVISFLDGENHYRVQRLEKI